MDAIKCIMTRRSIRQYTDEPVDGEVVEKILRAAMAAPSAANCQPWQFVVVRDQAKREAFAEFHPYGKMLASAPIGILVCGDTELELADGYWIQDCSAATENLLLAAHALGLGAVWLGITPREDRTAETRELFARQTTCSFASSIFEALTLLAVGGPSGNAAGYNSANAAPVSG